MIRAVFDCNVLVQATGNAAGPAGACLAAAGAGRFTLVTDSRTVAEYRDVMHRPKIRRKFADVTDDDIGRFLARLAVVAVALDDVATVVDLPRDPKDAMYLDLAVAAGADFVVTWDNALLDTTNPACTAPDAVAFRADHPTITVLTPPAFLARLAATP